MTAESQRTSPSDGLQWRETIGEQVDHPDRRDSHLLRAPHTATYVVAHNRFLFFFVHWQHLNINFLVYRMILETANIDCIDT